MSDNSEQLSPHSSLRKRLEGWLARSPDEPRKTVVVVLAVCVFFSVIVSAVAVALAPLRERNKELEKQRNILQVAGLYRPGVDIDKAFENIEARLVDLRTGEFSEDYDPQTWDPQLAAQDPELSTFPPPAEAPTGVNRMPKYATVYLVRRGEESTAPVDTVVLPIYGYGLWSTLWGVIAVRPDMNEIVGLKYYQQLETAGLGGEVDNPKWLAQWPSKKLRDDDGVYRLRLDKITPSSDQEYVVDALSGATMTSRGVDDMLRFWLGEKGLYPFMKKLKEQLED